MMESDSDGGLSSNDGEGDISVKLSKFMKDHNYSASPVVDVVEVDPIRHAESSACDDDFDDDELNDLLEEQILLKKIKCLKDYRKNLASYRDPELDKVDHHIKPKIENSSEIKNERKISPVCIDNDACDNDGIVDDKVLESILTTDATDSRQLFETRDHFENLKKLSKASSINVLMLSELTTLESVLMDRLKEVIKEQVEVRAEISRLKLLEKNDIIKKKRKAYWYTLFGRPYFKDEQRYACPKNEDAKIMKLKNQILTINLFPSRPWRIKEKYHLEEGVLKILLEEQTNKFYEREKEIKEQLKNNTICDSKMKKKLRSELQSINNQVALLEKKTLKELFSACKPDREFDWLRIAAHYVPKHSSEECQRMWHLYVKPTINKKGFTKDEENNLMKLVEKFGEQSWDVVAKNLGTSRSELLCFFHYQKRLKKGKNSCGKWTKGEDEKLIRIIKEFRIGESIPWPKVAFYFEGRSMQQLYTRWTNSLNPDLKKGRFNKVEDRLILSYVRKYGENFSKISKLLGYRNSTQIRQRYFLTKMINFNVGHWSLEEDEMLLALVEKYGVSHWCEISKQFMTRTRTQIRHRYKAITNFKKKYPHLGITDIHRGPIAKSQHVIPVGAAEVKAASKEQENKILSELVKESKMKKKMTPNHDIAITKLKRGRKKYCKRSKLDMKLIDYFKEVYSTEKLKLRTHYVKPDIDKAASALMLFCCYFKTSLILSGDEFEEGIKKLPNTLKRVVFRMIDDKRGCDNFKANLGDGSGESIVSYSNLASINRDALFIDYVSVDPRETLVGDSDYLLSVNKEGTDLDEVAVGSDRSKNSKVIPYFLPPNIITMIGCRSIMLIKGKILSSLANSSVRPSHFFPNDVSVMKKKNLKFFSGYFSDDELVSNCDAEVSKENPDPKISGKKKTSKVPDEIKISVPISRHNTDILVSPTPLMKSLLSDPSGDLRLSVSSNPLSNSNEIVPPLPSSSKEIETVLSLPSTSKVCDPPSPPTLFSDTPILFESDSDKPTDKKSVDEILNVRTKRLTKQEAIDLWKERLMVLFCWPLALTNHVPNFSADENESAEVGNSNEVKDFENPSHDNNSKSTPDKILPVKENTKSFNSEKYNLQNCQLTYENLSKRQSNCAGILEDNGYKNDVTSKLKPSSTAANEVPCTSNIEVEQRETIKQCSRSKNKFVKRKKIPTLSEITSDGSDVPQHSGKKTTENSVAQVSHKEPGALRSKRQRKSNKLLDEFEVYN